MSLIMYDGQTLYTDTTAVSYTNSTYDTGIAVIKSRVKKLYLSDSGDLAVAITGRVFGESDTDELRPYFALGYTLLTARKHWRSGAVELNDHVLTHLPELGGVVFMTSIDAFVTCQREGKFYVTPALSDGHSHIALGSAEILASRLLTTGLSTLEVVQTCVRFHWGCDARFPIEHISHEDLKPLSAARLREAKRFVTKIHQKS